MFTECSTKTLKIFFLVYFIFFFFTDAMKATWLRFVFIFFSFINYCSLDAWSFASDLMTRIYVGQFAVVLIFYYTLIYYRKKIYTLTSLVCFHKCIFRFLVLKKMVVIWNFTSGHFFFCGSYCHLSASLLVKLFSCSFFSCHEMSSDRQVFTRQKCFEKI